MEIKHREYNSKRVYPTKDPFDMFDKWMKEAIKSDVIDPNAMVLSTSYDNHPDSRVVLLKEYTEKGFVFYTNYESSKGTQLKYNKNCALLFYWPQLNRSIRIRGRVLFTSREESEEYFDSRPFYARIGAISSEQSQPIVHPLALIFKAAMRFISGARIIRPKSWGGYRIVPYHFEFWSGRKSRLHTRVAYQRLDSNNYSEWKHEYLQP